MHTLYALAVSALVLVIVLVPRALAAWMEEREARRYLADAETQG